MPGLHRYLGMGGFLGIGGEGVWGIFPSLLSATAGNMVPYHIQFWPQGSYCSDTKNKPTQYAPGWGMSQKSCDVFWGKTPAAGLLGGTTLTMDQNGPGFRDSDTYSSFSNIHMSSKTTCHGHCFTCGPQLQQTANVMVTSRPPLLEVRQS